MNTNNEGFSLAAKEEDSGGQQVYKRNLFSNSNINDYNILKPISLQDFFALGLNDNFLLSLSASLTIHLFIIYFFLFGLPSYFEIKPPREEVITFEMLPLSEISNVPTRKKQINESKPVEDAKKIEKSKTEVKPEIQPKIKDSNKALTKKDTAEIIEKKEEKEVKPKEDTTPEDSTEKLKKKDLQKIKRPIMNNELDSLLKNLEKESNGTKINSNKRSQNSKDQGEQKSKGRYNEDSPISMQYKDLVVNQVSRHWNVPIGSENIEQVKIMLYILLNIDGSLLEVRIHEKTCGKASNVSCHLIAESALRAVKQASPLQGLPKERYDSWKEFYFLFDPSKVAR